MTALRVFPPRIGEIRTSDGPDEYRWKVWTGTEWQYAVTHTEAYGYHERICKGYQDTDNTPEQLNDEL